MKRPLQFNVAPRPTHSRQYRAALISLNEQIARATGEERDRLLGTRHGLLNDRLVAFYRGQGDEGLRRMLEDAEHILPTDQEAA